MVSGAGRRLTLRSDSALARRRVMASASSSQAIARARCAIWASPRTGRSSASRSSTSRRCSTSSTAVSRHMIVAPHSLIRPAARWAMVRGISLASARASPRCRDPRAGESRLASATCAATPRPRSRAGMPCAACAARWEASNATVTRACAAAAAPLIDSSSPIWSTRSASSSDSPPTAPSRSRKTARSSVVSAPGSVSRMCPVWVRGLTVMNDLRRRVGPTGDARQVATSPCRLTRRRQGPSEHSASLQKILWLSS